MMRCERIGWMVLLAVAGTLIPLPAAAYTPKVTAHGALVRWHDARVEIRIDPSSERLLAPEQVRRALTIATEAWRGLPGVPDLVVAPGEPGPAGHDPVVGPTNGIYVPDPWPYDPRRLAVTVTTYDAHTGRLLDTDVFINPEMPFDLLPEDEDRPRDRYDLASVLAHELGHVLGLDETDVPDATMGPEISRGEVHQRTLEPDDENGAIALYHDAMLDTETAGVGCGGANVAGALTSRGAPAAAVTVGWLLIWLRRRC
ncbi:MAG: matrixin family metalloprotease [Myxococcota bacterium]